jgi:branched-chain amino acid transport system ATP-binding protein
MADTLLSLKGVRAGYGDAVVLNDISFDLADKGSLAVLGRNGVGKSTLLLTIMGFTRMTRGTIHWRGSDITRVAPYKRARAGIGWVAQEREIFPSLTVAENLTVTARPGHWTIERIYDLLPRLNERRGNKGNQLSGGEQQMLALARALMTNPSLLLLDEPFEGLAPIIVEELAAAIRKMRNGAGAHRKRHRDRARQCGASCALRRTDEGRGDAGTPDRAEGGLTTLSEIASRAQRSVQRCAAEPGPIDFLEQ